MTLSAAVMKCLATVLALALLTMRLGCFSEEVFVTPVEDCLFDRIFLAAETEGDGKVQTLLKGQSWMAWEVPAKVAVQVVLKETPVSPGLPPKLLVRYFPAEIFIPPEHGFTGTPVA